ncbi:MAG TPA: hypothetical protein VF132_08940, partial [Rudaea sp.]
MKNEIFSAQRRSLLGSAAVAVAATTLASGTTQAATSGASESSGVPAPPPLKDPQGLYPKPPFDNQSQPWPGLASKMTP